MDMTITSAHEVVVKGHKVGHLHGLLFAPDQANNDPEVKSLLATIGLELAPEIDRRLTQIAGSSHTTIELSDTGQLMWNETAVAKLVAGPELLKPEIELIGGQIGTPDLCDLAAARLRDYMRTEITQKLQCLFDLKEFIDDPRSFKGAHEIAQTLIENHGVLERQTHLDLIDNTDKIARGYIRNKSGRFGYHYVFLRDLMKPAPARLVSILFAFAWKKDGGGHRHPFLPANGLTSVVDDKSYSETCLNKAGYTRRGPRIIRFDVLDNLHKIILQAQGNRDGNEFRVAQQMLYALGCDFETIRQVLIALGYRAQTAELNAKDYEEHKLAVTEYAYRTKLLERPQIPPVPPKPEPVLKPGERPPGYIPKRQREHNKPIANYVNTAQLDEKGKLIIPREVEVWRLIFKKNTSTYKAGGRKKTKDSVRDYAHHQATAQSQNKPSQGRPAAPKRSKLQGYANLSASKKAGDAARTPIKPDYQARPKNTKSENPDDSPFAALAGLQFDKPTEKQKKPAKPTPKTTKDKKE